MTFIERDRRAQALIAENLALCGIENVYAIIRAKVARALDTLGEQAGSSPFDIVLLDPPYAPQSRDDIEPILTAAGRLLAPTGVLVLEHARRAPGARDAGIWSRIVAGIPRTVISGDSSTRCRFTTAGRKGKSRAR